MLDHIFKPCIDHVLAHGVEHLEFSVEDPVALWPHGVPDRDATVGRNGVVVAGELCGIFGLFEISPGFERSHTLPVQGGPVDDRPVKATDMDEIEVVFFERPLGFHIVNLERDVGWRPVVLGGR